MTDQLFIENLEEYVNDESRIVTYKWLSKTLTVHVNLAKQMLFSFVQKERNKKDNDSLTVTYFVSGFIEQDGEKVHKMQVVPEERLEATKQTLQPLTSCHIYSVQKCKVKDTNVLYLTDVDLIKEQIHNSNKYSAIKCTCAKLRSEEELLKLRTVAQPTSNAPSFTKPKSQDTNVSSSAPQSKKPTGIAGMFATTGKKKEEKPVAGKKKEEKPSESATKSENTEKKTETTKPKAKAGIANFFGNQASKPKKPTAEPEAKESEKKSQVARKQTTPKKSPSPKPQKTKSRKQKVEDSDDDDSNQQKKRRRIKAAAWSDSSSDEEEAMEEEPIPPPSPYRDPTPPPKEPTPSPEKKQKAPTPSPEKKENQVPSEGGQSGGKKRGRKRQKKMVSKSFVDDDGFMVTEKVWEDVSESASETDEPIPPTPPVKQSKMNNEKKKTTPTKKVSPGKASSGKQTSLMSFFKKK